MTREGIPREFGERIVRFFRATGTPELCQPVPKTDPRKRVRASWRKVGNDRSAAVMVSPNRFEQHLKSMLTRT